MATHRSDLILKTFFSYVGYNLCPTEAGTPAGKQCMLSSLSAPIYQGRTKCMSQHQAFPSQPSDLDLEMSVKKRYGMDRDSGTCLLLFESLGFPSCCHFVFPVGLSWGVWYCCFQNAYLEASLYVLEHEMWQFSNKVCLLLSSIHLEAVPFDVPSWVFSSSHFSL